jgi:tRNA 5-methylaminomethyl-2-thiouridine biosynthesis bifunctional protein
MSEPLDWDGEAPRSSRFGDIYFSPLDGWAETQTVFLTGCGLPEAWAGRRQFTVGELGFGTGLNILALIDLWRRHRPSPCAVLNVFSVEGFPMSRMDAARALASWPDLTDLAGPLMAQWPGGRRGFHRIAWPDAGVILDLAILEAEAALAAWSGFADAWFLDGFAPSKNPEMWRPEVMALVTARSRPGARAATFSVAGAVRRGLEDAGFKLTRAPGFGRKKERLEAVLQRGHAETHPASDAEHPRPRVAIVGAGIAGASLARAFAALGCAAAVIDPSGAGGGASGNPAALVTPRLDAGLNLNAELHAQAFARAVQLYANETPSAVIAQGALQLADSPRDTHRFAKLAVWDGFDPGSIERLDEADAALALDEGSATQALRLHDALVVEPAAVLEAWLPPALIAAQVAAVERAGDVWRLLDGQGDLIVEADVVCLAAGPATARLTVAVPVRAVRGQASFTDAVSFSGAPASFGGYAIPTRRGVLFGATHARDDWDETARPEDDVRNLEGLAIGRPALAKRIADTTLSARASLRAMTHDYLPLAGSVPGEPGLFLLTGLGGRGFSLAPLLAEAVAAEALGAPNPLPRALSKIVSPNRFADRPRGS